MEIVRRTTPTITFKLPFQTDTVSNLEIYFGQPKLMFTKTEEDCVLDGDLIAVTLTEEETLMLDDKLLLKMQLRFVFTNGRKGASKPIYCDVIEIMKDGEDDVSD